jgi:tRNA1(Val) A37 N6-methylase TrmN6
MQWPTTGTELISVQYDSHMDGGGTWFGTDYVTEIRSRYPNRIFERCLEWCSGPGFIGFDILSHGLSKNLVLHDCYHPAIGKVKETVALHDLSARVRYHCGREIDIIPKDQKFDLVVANPPHYAVCPGDDNYQRIAVDTDWTAHRMFYQQILQYLSDDGRILIQENQAGSEQGVETFRHTIESNGLEILDVSASQQFWNVPGPWCQIYYIEIRAKK